MDLLLIVGMLIIFALVVDTFEKRGQANSEPASSKKECPPHQWVYEPIKDHEGLTHALNLVCSRCGLDSSTSQGDE